MKNLLVLILTFSATFLSAQKTVTWVGGTPGQKTNWNEPRNWSDNSVPGEFSNVLITDVSTSTFSLPVISEGVVAINSIRIESQGKLTIAEDAKLIVYEACWGEENIELQQEESLHMVMEYDDELCCYQKRID